MKKFLMLITFVLTTSVTYGQDIADVTRSGNTLTALDDKNSQISSKYFGTDDELSGFSSYIIVIRSGNTVTVYNQKFDQISSKYFGSEDKVKSVTGNNINIKSGNTVTTYDKNFNQISSRYE